MNKRFSLYLCFTITTLFGMVATVNSPLLTNISATFHLNLAQSGILFTSNFIGFATFILIGGILADKVSKKVVLSISLVGLSITLFLFPLASNFYIAMIIMLFIGGFGGIVESLSSAVVAEIYPEKAVFYINISQAFFGIGAFIGPILTGFTISRGVSWEACYIALGILMLLTSFVFIANKMIISAQNEKITWQSFTSLVTNKKFILICLCMFLYSGSEVGGWSWLCTFLKKNSAFSIVTSSLAVGVFWLAMTIGRLICGFLINRVSTKKLIISLSTAAGIVTFFSAIVSSTYSIWIIIALMGLTYSSIWPLIIAYGDTLYQKSKGTVFALIIGSGGVGASVIPFIMGVIAQNANIRFAMMSPALLLFMLGMIFIRFKD